MSRITPAKRQNLAIEAFKGFYERNKNFKMIIAGRVDDNKYSKEYLESLKAISREYPVEFALFLSIGEVYDMYANCYATLFAAKNEDFGLTPLESMASCKPVISLNEGGPRETIVDGVTGFLVEDVKGMTEKMIYLAANRDETKKIGEKGRAHVEKNFAQPAFFNRIDSVIKNQLKNAGK